MPNSFMDTTYSLESAAGAVLIQLRGELGQVQVRTASFIKGSHEWVR